MTTLRVTIRVKPGASRTRVGGSYGAGDSADDPPPALIVAVNAPAVDGRANDAVLAALADALGVRPRQLRLVSGHTARTKVVEITDDESRAGGGAGAVDLSSRIAKLLTSS